GSERHLLQPLATQTSQQETALVSTGRAFTQYRRLLEQAGVAAAGVVPYRRHTLPATHRDPMPTVTSEQVPGLLTAVDDWEETLADVELDECHYRMLTAAEIGRGCGFDPALPGREGTFVVWGSERAQVDG